MNSRSVVASTLRIAAIAITIACASGAAAAGEPQESRRMARAKDLFADEQWTRAIAEFKGAVADSKERSKDEALYWMAQSQNQAGDLAAAVETIRTLERDYPRSRWVHPGRSLLIELAQKLRRDDFLWWTATPNAPKAIPFPAAPFPPAPLDDAVVVPPSPAAPVSAAPPPARVAPGGGGARPAPAPKIAKPPVATPAEAETPRPPTFFYVPDADLRIQALSSLIHTDEDKAIPMLKNIALAQNNTMAARRAVFVLAQSRLPKAQSAVVEVATTGPEPVQIVAVRELARFGDPDVSKTLLRVYSTAKAPVKREVVSSLGRRAEVAALVRLVDTERNVELREAMVTSLGRAGGREPLQKLYFRDNGRLKEPIILSLFSCRGDAELIKIAEEETDPRLKSEAFRRLRLMGTPTAKAFVEKTRAKTAR